jgi:hypothetical protein
VREPLPHPCGQLDRSLEDSRCDRIQLIGDGSTAIPSSLEWNCTTTGEWIEHNWRIVDVRPKRSEAMDARSRFVVGRQGKRSFMTIATAYQPNAKLIRRSDSVPIYDWISVNLK